MATGLQLSHNSLLVDAFRNGLQSFVLQYNPNISGNTSNNALALTASSIAPIGASQFYSTVVNRASIPNIAQDLRVSFGIERLQTQQLTLLQSEFGPNGEPVWGATNDTNGLIRFVGSSWLDGVTSASLSEGNRIQATTVGDYMEIVFFGNALNILHEGNGTADLRATVDGGTEGSQLITASESGVLTARNYSTNQVYNVVSGLTLGIHTVKIRLNSGAVRHYGFEIVNTSSVTNTTVNPGTAYIDGLKTTLSAAQTIGFAAAATGTRGGRMVTYLTSAGAVTQAFQAVDSTALYLTAASHNNEEMVRQYSFREFGAGRSDDFSTLAGTQSARAFTLDDGTTTLVAQATLTDTLLPEIVRTGGNGNVITLTFVGTGLDIIQRDQGNGGSDTYTVAIDGAAGLALPTAGSTTPRTVKIASGLPYGTHTVRWTRVSAASWDLGIVAFKVYQPKKPSLPAGAVELADYNVMANYVANTTQGTANIGTGVLRKDCTREWAYANSGASWTLSTDFTHGMGFYAESGVGNTAGTARFTFFGTGFDFRYGLNTGTQSVSATLNGTAMNAANFPTASFGAYGGTFNLTTGGLNATAGAYSAAAGLSVSNLPLGVYTVIFSINGDFTVNWLDIITPIHSVKSNLVADLQNTLPVGSQSISDNRKTSAIKEILPSQKAWAQAVGVQVSPTTTSTVPVPIPDLSLTIKTTGGPLELHAQLGWNQATSNADRFLYIYVDGVQVLATGDALMSGTTDRPWVNLYGIVPVSAGIHKVDAYWSTASGTLSLVNANRYLTAKEF